MKTIKIAFNNTISTIHTDESGLKAIISLLEQMNCDCEVYELENKSFKLTKQMYELKKT